MKNSFASSHWRTLLPCGFILLALLGGVAQGAPSGTAFTYQGRLNDGGSPATGNYDLRFALYDAGTVGALVGTPTTITLAPVSVANGLFTVTLDFGGATFAGNARWLEIAVRPNGSAVAHTVLSPRQPLTPAPYALYSPTAGTATSVPWSALTGLPPGFADGLDNDTTYSAGAGLTLSGTTFSVAPSGIIPSMLADNAVTTAKLADGSVTATKVSGGQVVKSLNSLKDDVSLVAGVNVSITPSGGNSLQISASGGSGWGLTGNGGTTGANFLGTTDDQAFELKVNGARALRLEPAGGEPNVIGGYSGNVVSGGSSGATISGGGSSGFENRISSSYATVGGGAGNTNSGSYGTVGGGVRNTASGRFATVGGGVRNTSSEQSATVGGGEQNTSSGFSATVGGGLYNTSSGEGGTVGGGVQNTNIGTYCTVGGGIQNTSSGEGGTVGGGFVNTASGFSAAVPGGELNTAGGDWSLAAGYRARALHSGAFVWADSTEADFASTAPKQFLIRASGNVGIGTDTPTAALDVAGSVRARGLLRTGSESGSSQAPAPAGLVVRRINSTDSSASQVVARTDSLTLERDGSSGGFVIRYQGSPVRTTIACMGIDNAGNNVNFYTALTFAPVSGFVQIYTDGQNIVHFQCTFGRTYHAEQHLTQVTLSRFAGDNFWSGTVTSTYDQ